MSKFITKDTPVVYFERGSGLGDHAAELAEHIGGISAYCGSSSHGPGQSPRIGFLLTVMHKDVDRLYCDLIRCFGGVGGAKLGLITGLDLREVEQAIARVKISENYVDRPWIVTETSPNILVDSGELLAMDRLDHAALARVLPRRARFAVISGHGREDILSVGSQQAFCGRRMNAGANTVPNCQKEKCSYPQDKLPVDGINAGVLVLLSCNAGRLGKGLMPPSTRLAQTASRSCRAVIAPRRLYTHNDALLQLVLTMLLEGRTASDVTLAANSMQKDLFGEIDVFVIFGDPDAAPTAVSYQRVEEPLNTSGHTNLVEKIGKLITFVEDMTSVGLLHAELDAAGKAARKLETLLHSAVVPREVVSKAQRFLGLLDQLLYATAQELLARTANSYFWVSSHYRLLPGFESVIDCPLCRSQCYEQRFSHTRLNSRNRVRQTCSVCGIVTDRPLRETAELTFATEALQSAHAFTSETVLTITTGESPVYLAVGLNNIGAASEEQHVVKVGSSPVAEPILLKPGVSRLTISVDIGALRSGLYFLKVYLVSLVGITERSVPIRAWKDARLEQP